MKIKALNKSIKGQTNWSPKSLALFFFFVLTKSNEGVWNCENQNQMRKKEKRKKEEKPTTLCRCPLRVSLLLFLIFNQTDWLWILS